MNKFKLTFKDSFGELKSIQYLSEYDYIEACNELARSVNEYLAKKNTTTFILDIEIGKCAFIPVSVLANTDYTLEEVTSLEERYKNQLQGKSFLGSKNEVYFFSHINKHGNAKIFWDNGETQHNLEFIFERIKSGEWVIQKD